MAARSRAWQGKKFRVEARPLAQDLRIGPRILELVAGDAGELVRRDIADAVARGLNGVHLDPGKVFQQVGHLFQLDPVVLDVLAGGEMAVVAIVFARDHGELAKLDRRQHAIGNRNPQHVGVKLQIEAVHQPQRFELIFGQLTGQPAGYLATELGSAVGHHFPVESVVLIHRLLLGPLDEIDTSGGPRRAVGVLQRLDHGAAFGLLAVMKMVGRAERPDSLAIAERRPEAFGLDQVDQIDIDHNSGLGLARSFGVGSSGIVINE